MSTLAEGYCYCYPRPALTVDAVVFSFTGNNLKVLLIQRADEPFKNGWAFPGGFVNENETVEFAVARELKEETGLENVRLTQFYTASAPGRDPRGWTVSVFFYGFFLAGSYKLKAGDDAIKAEWFEISKLPAMAFDHYDMLQKAVGTLRKEALTAVVGNELFPGIVPAEVLVSFFRQITGSMKKGKEILNRLVKSKVVDASEGMGNLRFIRSDDSE